MMPQRIKRRLRRWEVWAVFTRGHGGPVLKESRMTAFPFRWLARDHAKALNCSPAILAESLRSLGSDGRLTWVDCDVRRATELIPPKDLERAKQFVRDRGWVR